MSIFGAMATAVLGLNAQSRSLGHISDNIANAQTVGYKRVNTSFETLVLQSNSRIHSPGGVVAQPSYTNNIQGSLSQVQSSTSLAIQGEGFFAVSRAPNSAAPGAVSDSTRMPTYYTRAGDFELNHDRYLVNSAGYALNGWSIDPHTNAIATTAAPIQVTALGSDPVTTSQIQLSANLPSTPAADRPIPATSIQVYDAQGTTRTINLKWRQQAANEWRLDVEAPGSAVDPVNGTFPGFAVTAVPGPVTQGQSPRAQVDTHTFSGESIKIGDVYAITVKGVPYSIEVTRTNVATLANYNGIAAALADRINSAVPAAGVTATTASGGKLILTSSTPGTPFTSTSNIDNADPTNNEFEVPSPSRAATTTRPQVSLVRFSGPGIDIGDRFVMSVPTRTVDSTTGAVTTGRAVVTLTVTAVNIESLGNVNGVAQRLADKINAVAGSTAIATPIGGDIQMTGKYNGVAFEMETSHVSLTNGSLTPSAVAKATIPTNIVGVRQRQTISLTGTMGDVGARYSLNIKSPTTTNATVETATLPTSTTPQVSHATFIGPDISVGDEYRFEIEGTTYSLLVTNDNIADLVDIGGVARALSDKVNNDGGAPVAARVISLPALPPGTTPRTTIELTGRTVNSTINVSGGVRPDPFNRTVEYITTGEETSLQDISSRLAAMVNAMGLPVTAASVGGVVQLASTVDGGQFTATPSSTRGNTPAHIGLTFGGTDPVTGEVTPPGTLTRIDTARVGTGSATSPVRREAGMPATIDFVVDYGFGPQRVTLDLGHFQQPGGLTQYAGDSVTVSQVHQNGSARGVFKNVEISQGGDVVVNYDNGRTRTVARVPVVLFNNANALKRESGGIFMETLESGPPRPKDTSQDSTREGAGTIVVSSLENSNVDIADEFTKLIVTQRTYSANTKIVTTSDEMLQEVIGLKR